MIAHLRGIMGKHLPGEATIDVGGVGYRVLMPVQDWDSVLEGSMVMVFTHAHIREDKFDLYGFMDAASRSLFQALINLDGIGPRMGLELCSVPKTVLMSAIQQKDASILQSVKGVGKKTAEKLLLELTSLAERQPEMFSGGSMHPLGARFDKDTVAALSQLGFGTQDILRTLETLPLELTTTEERITAALRML